VNLAPLAYRLAVPLALLLVVARAELSDAHPASAGDAALQGDVNCSQNVDSVDSLQILRSVAGLPTNANCLDGAGDVNCSGAADAVDALNILRFIAGLGSGAPDGCTPIGEPLEPEVPATSEELIAAALEAGDITYEKSLLERAYALYADPRQDARFVSPIIDWEAASALLAEIDENEAQLSAGLLAELAPFRARPNDPISIFNNPPAGARSAPQGFAWRSLPAPGTNARVWANTTPDDDMGKYVNAVTTVWSAMGPSPGDGQPAIFPYPREDQAYVPDAEINPDSAIDFYFINRSAIDPRSALCQTDPTNENCLSLSARQASGVAIRTAEHIGITTSAYLMINDYLSGDFLLSTTAHELAHASQFAFDAFETLWLYESTATWVEYRVLKRLNKYPAFPYDAAKVLFPLLEERLTKDNDHHNYGSWIFFFFATMETGSDQIVTSVWESAALPGLDGIDAVDQAFNLDDHFDDFTVRNWNRDPVPNQYKTKDDALKDLAPKITENNQAGPDMYPLDKPLPPLSAQYYSFKFTQPVRRVTFRNLVKDVPNAHVWAIPQIDFTWQPPEDWSEESEKVFCRDLEEENLTQLVVIISNSDHANNDTALPVSPHARINAQAAGCKGWKGIAHSQHTEPATGGVRVVTNDASLFWEYHDFDRATEPYFEQCELDPDPCLVYTPRGFIDWNYSYTRGQPFPCVEDYSGTVAAGSIIIRRDQELLLRPDGSGGYFYSGQGFDPNFSIDIVCEISGCCAPVNFFHAPESEGFKVSADGQTISGHYEFSPFNDSGPETYEYDWQLEYVGEPP
jgi:hypothetical protein